MQEQEPKGLLTPQVMPEPDLEASGIQLDDGDAADIAHEALMPHCLQKILSQILLLNRRRDERRNTIKCRYEASHCKHYN